MGNFYTNITLRGPELDPVLAYLDAEAIVAYVGAPQPGYVVVYDRASESQDEAILMARAAQLSRHFSCVAFAVLNHDDDVLAYWLYENGVQIDSYNSLPGWETGDESPPSGGDAAALCRVFGVPETQAESIEDILRADSNENAQLPFGPGSDITLAELMSAAISPERMADLMRRLLGVESLEGLTPDEIARRMQSSGGRDYTSAVDRHGTLAEALNVPGCTVGFGFDTIHDGDLPGDLSDDDLWLTGPEE
jgi:hypothetical protein